MKRFTVFRNDLKKDGKVLSISQDTSLNDVLKAASDKLETTVKKLYTQQGGHVDDVELIRDDDVLLASYGELCRDLLECREDSPLLTCSSKLQTTRGLFPQASDDRSNSSDWITLNVGGQLFSTTRSTLTRTDPNSMLARMFEDERGKDILLAWKSSVDESGAYLIDRSPLYFEPILNYLRHRKLILDKNINPAGVLEEAKFFGLTSLIETLEDIIDKEQPADDSSPITRREFVFRLLSTPTTIELRCQGMNFTGANLSKLDLRHINFKYAVLKNANLSGANLSYCNFERADLSRAILDSANLLGVKMLCVNLEGGSLRGCNFEDPAGSRANMEGALMKNVDLEGSHMAGVNLRVANLKNANLQNCDLRGAVLAGADLENCDLSGCDLQEANLRGANLKGAAFELMINPLHMAQTVR